MKKKIFCVTTLAVLSCLFFFCAFVKAEDNGLSIQSLDYNFTTGYSYNVFGKYNSSTRSDEDIYTTFNNDGFLLRFEVDGELYPGTVSGCDDIDDILKISENNETFENNGLILSVNFAKEGGNKVIVTQKIKNVQSVSKDFKLASGADIQLGDNDYSAVYRNGSELFRVTQDNKEGYSDTYGAQFSIELSPAATTAWVGEYWEPDAYYEHFYDTSDITEITYADSMDSAFTYSWMDTIAAGETKTFTTTYLLRKAEEQEVKFHCYGESCVDDEFEPIIRKTILSGGAFMAPNVHEEEGYNYKWYERQNGTGIAYVGGKNLVATSLVSDFYEVRKKNGVVINNDVDQTERNTNYGAAVISDSDVISKLPASYLEDLESSYDNLLITTLVENIIDSVSDEDKEKALQNENDNLGAVLEVGFYKGKEEKELIEDLSGEMKIKITIPEELRNHNPSMYRAYKVVKILEDGSAEDMEFEFNDETFELEFFADGKTNYAIIYSDIAYLVPDTGYIK